MIAQWFAVKGANAESLRRGQAEAVVGGQTSPT